MKGSRGTHAQEQGLRGVLVLGKVIEGDHGTHNGGAGEFPCPTMEVRGFPVPGNGSSEESLLGF